MSALFDKFHDEFIYTLAAFIFLIVFRFILTTAANKVGKRSNINLARVQLMVRYINFLVFFLAIFVLLLVWGVQVRDVTLVFSSVFAVIGIGLFAVWSILSNITSGVIMFFSFPYKIFGLDINDIFIAGEYGAIFHYNGLRWNYNNTFFSEEIRPRSIHVNNTNIVITGHYRLGIFTNAFVIRGYR